jgi:hypothetical protein
MQRDLNLFPPPQTATTELFGGGSVSFRAFPDGNWVVSNFSEAFAKWITGVSGIFF